MIVRKRPEPGRVSVVIAGECSPERIRASLESVAAQTYESVRIVCVDTSESDEARNAAESGIAAAAWIPLPGAGPAAARNAGVEKTDGQFVAFLEPGGVWAPAKLERQIALMHAHRDVGLVFSRVRVGEGAGSAAQMPAPGAAWEALFEAGVGVDDPAAFYARLVRGEIVPLSSVIVRRVSLPTEGPFRHARRPHEDHDFVLRISELTRFAFVDDVLATIPNPRPRLDVTGVEAAMSALDIFRDNVARNPWLLARDPRAMRKRERDLIRESGRRLVEEGRGAEARPILAKALRRNFLDLRLTAVYLSSLAPFRRGPAETR